MTINISNVEHTYRQAKKKGGNPLASKAVTSVDPEEVSCHATPQLPPVLLSWREREKKRILCTSQNVVLNIEFPLLPAWDCMEYKPDVGRGGLN